MSHKLDAMVAERVMGWKWHLCDQLNPQGEMVYHFRNDEPPEHWKRPTVVATPTLPEVRGVRLFVYLGLRNYSTDIAAAWEVRQEIKRRDLEITVSTHGGLGNKTDDTCIIRGGEEERWDGSANTAPLAICLAALRAVGVTEAEIEEAMR